MRGSRVGFPGSSLAWLSVYNLGSSGWCQYSRRRWSPFPEECLDLGLQEQGSRQLLGSEASLAAHPVQPLRALRFPQWADRRTAVHTRMVKCTLIVKIVSCKYICTSAHSVGHTHRYDIHRCYLYHTTKINPEGFALSFAFNASFH